MAKMSQKCPAGFQFFDQAYGLGKRKMCEMLAVTQSVDNQRIKSCQLLFLTFVDMLGIRHISESADAVSEYRLLTVHHLYGHNFQSVDIERIIVDYAHIEFRDSGVGVLGEAVIQPFSQVGVHVAAHVQRQVAHRTEGTQVVYSSYMVIMTVGNEHGVDVEYIVLQCLGAKICRWVDQYVHAVCPHQHGRAQSFVTGILRSAYAAFAANLGHSFRCAAAKHRDQDRRIDIVYFRTQIDVEFPSHRRADRLGYIHDVTGRGSAGVGNHQRLFLPYYSPSDTIAFHAGLVDQPGCG